MKKINSTYSTILTSLVLGIGLTGCNGSSSSDDTTSTSSPTALELTNPVTLLFTSVSDSTYLGEGAEFTLSGTEVENLIIQGATLNDDGSYTADGGPVVLSRGDDSSATAFDIEIFVTTDGYFSTGTTLSFEATSEQTDDETSYVLSLTPLQPTTTELAITAKTATLTSDSSGTVASDVEIGTDIPSAGDANQAAIANSTVTLSIPANTQLLDSSGNPVTGTITANVVYFSNEPNGNITGVSALGSFPGGLSPSSILDENGDVDSSLAGITFISGGFTAIQLQNESGVVVSQFSDPVVLTFTMSADTINPYTGSAIQAGDTIPTWSYDETTGQWKAEGDATIGSLDSTTNTYTVAKEITHLSYYNLDWHYGVVCRPNIQFQDANGYNSYSPAVSFIRDGGGWAATVYINGLTNHSFNNVPNRYWNGNSITGSVRVTPRNSRGTDLIQSIVKSGTALTVEDNQYKGSFCDLDGATITLETPVVETSDLSVTLQTTCTDNGVVTQQPGYAYLYTTDWYYSGYLRPTAESAALKTVENGSYYIYSYMYLGSSWRYLWQRTSVNVSDDTSVVVNYNIDNCATTTGTTGTSGASGGTGG